MVAKKETLAKNSLAQRRVGKLSKKDPVMSVGMLTKELAKIFPVEDGEAWDRNGLIVGDPAAFVTRIAFALDPTVAAIREAKAKGANVLLTHHPVFLNAPDSFLPGDSDMLCSGAGIFAAIENQVALINFHTPLDASKNASRILPELLNLELKSILQPFDKDSRKGYGQICHTKTSEAALTLGQLGARCTSVFSRPPRVWGDFSKNISTIVTGSGSGGDLLKDCLSLSVDCLVCGEIRYHDALSASEAGLCLIELGHDISELPLVAVLIQAVESIGFSEEKLVVIDQGNNWNYPETVRI